MDGSRTRRYIRTEISQKSPMIWPLPRRASVIWMLTMVGKRAKQWIHLALPSKPLKLSGLIRGTSVPAARTQVCSDLALGGNSKIGDYKNGSLGMEKFPMNGAWECAWDLTRRERTLDEFLIWTPPLKGFVKRASGKLWRYFEARDSRDIHPVWRPMPSRAFRSWRTSRRSCCLTDVKETDIFRRD